MTQGEMVGMGFVVVAMALVAWTFRPRRCASIDVGEMSSAWGAEHTYRDGKRGW